MEMVAPHVTPEDGVTRYQGDPTQGPACAMAAGGAPIFAITSYGLTTMAPSAARPARASSTACATSARHCPLEVRLFSYDGRVSPGVKEWVREFG